MDLDSIYAAYQQDASFNHLREEGFHFVPGNGNESANVIFVGEAPGETEDKHRKPFIGRAGKILIGFLNEVNLDRNEVFLTNVLKYRPSINNRNPTVPEIQASIPYLAKEIEVVKPKLIVALGKIPSQAFLPSKEPWRVRGRILKYDGYKLLITHHPMATVHREQTVEEIKTHFKLIREVAM